MTALWTDALMPCRAASVPPVRNPEPIAFHGSSFCRIKASVQSKLEKSPPHTAKLPPVMGARLLTALSAPTKRSPFGEFLAPLYACTTPPPIAPIAKAPPKSSRMRHGLKKGEGLSSPHDAKRPSLPWLTSQVRLVHRRRRRCLTTCAVVGFLSVQSNRKAAKKKKKTKKKKHAPPLKKREPTCTRQHRRRDRAKTAGDEGRFVKPRGTLLRVAHSAKMGEGVTEFLSRRASSLNGRRDAGERAHRAHAAQRRPVRQGQDGTRFELWERNSSLDLG